jgi:Raf kinase inhibitor-like YbhB/YbcL family protein
VHWLLYDLPAATTMLAAGADLPAGAEEGVTSFGPVGYGGPCPPPGPAHEYVFTLYALDTLLNLGPGATAQQLTDAIEGHVIGIAELSGTYAR